MIGVECDLIFEDRPMDNEQICLPNSSITKNCPKIITITQPPSDSHDSAPANSKASDAHNNISPSNIPLPPPDKDEPAEPNKETAASPESSPPTTNKDDVQTTRQSTQVQKPSPYVHTLGVRGPGNQ